MRHALICSGCGEYAELPGGCECPEVAEMAEIEHQPAAACMTGGWPALHVRPGFSEVGNLDAPWLLPVGGVSVNVADGVAVCTVEREE